MMHWGSAGLEGKAYSSVTVKRLAGYLHRDVPQLILAGSNGGLQCRAHARGTVPNKDSHR